MQARGRLERRAALLSNGMKMPISCWPSGGTMTGVTSGFLDRLSRSRGGLSDYRIAKLLRVPQSTVCNWRNGRAEAGPELAVRLGGLLKIDPAIVLCHTQAERAKCPEVAAVYLRLALSAELAQLPDTVQEQCTAPGTKEPAAAG